MRTGRPRREGRPAVSVLMFGLRAAEGVRARPRLSVRPLVYRGPGAFAAALRLTISPHGREPDALFWC